MSELMISLILYFSKYENAFATYRESVIPFLVAVVGKLKLLNFYFGN